MVERLRLRRIQYVQEAPLRRRSGRAQRVRRA